MNSNIKSTISTLNNLIETLKDGQHGFKTAAEDVKVAELSNLFHRYSAQRAGFVAELQARVLALGADVEKSGSVAGSVHRGWINLKTALSSNDPHSVLSECERGEDSAIAAYKKALENTELDVPTREIIDLQHREVKTTHDNVKQLRDSHVYRKAS